ncbi:NADH-quinone oxidoreductase subunit L [Inquilinus sp. CAU 1745]|uniref:NADH-quinone oxidoreductase subunit L n=1 Tax=Inquilinus sp. CAU 1745 TaxID=3140369 RepID=UPI00325B61C4
MEVAAIFLPLIGFLIAGCLGRVIGHRASMAVTVASVCAAAILSIWLFVDVALGGETRTITLFTWIESGDFAVDWALRFDTLTAVMLIVVNGVSAMVHIYSIGYMSHDPHRARFFAYLSLFTFMMLMLVTADNLVQMFFGWEGVGLASYLLIGFWYEKKSANDASIKAFVVNRVGDFGFLLGIFAIFVIFGSVEFDTVFEAAPAMADATFNFLGYEVPALNTACLLLFVGAMGKSAQLGLHTWLPDAMEGPTPVSALIHAATMVTAGVFMIARLSPVFEYAPTALMVVTIVGATTAFVAATIGLTQTDIKRVIAYSTMSQLGYMFFALGVSAYEAAIFHLMTHAFFKALLFLGSGSVIHAMSDEQDMRKMGGIWRMIPVTYAMMWIGSLALAGVGVYGVFGFAGFYSKDIILESAFADHSWFGSYAFWLGTIAALLTAFYSWRLLLMTFHGQPRADEKTMAHVHESPWVMLGPLVVLAIGAVFAGYVGYDAFVHHGREAFWGDSILVLEANDTIEAAHHVPFWVKILPVVMGLIGIGLAYLFYMGRPYLPGLTATVFRPLYNLSFRKWYFDEIYDFFVVRFSMWLGRGLWKSGDVAIIDGVGPDGIARVTRDIARRTSALQTGYLYHYAFAMLIGVVALVSWYLYSVRG